MEAVNFNTPQIYKFIRNVSEYVKCSLPEQFKLSWGGDVGISEALEPGWKISPSIRHEDSHFHTGLTHSHTP
jgi:hypothetical protein